MITQKKAKNLQVGDKLVSKSGVVTDWVATSVRVHGESVYVYWGDDNADSFFEAYCLSDVIEVA
jgi:hypothetical protein